MSDMQMEQMPAVDPVAEAEVKRRLRAIEAEHCVRIRSPWRAAAGPRGSRARIVIAMSGSSTPPMSLPVLHEVLPLGTKVRDAIDAFIAAKLQAKESGRGERVPLFDQIIGDEITRARFPDVYSPAPKLIDKANAVFVQTLNRAE